MHPRSPVDARRQGRRGGTEQRELLLGLLLLLLLLVGLGVHVVVLGLILEVLQMLPMVPVVVLLVVVELLRGGRRGSVLAHDAAAGNLWVVDEGSHHGGGTEWVGGEAWLRVLCEDVGVGEQVPLVCVLASPQHRGKGGIWMRCFSPLFLARTRPRPRERDKKKEFPHDLDL